MRRMLVRVAIGAAFLAALLLTPSQAAADSLVGSVTVSRLYPTAGSSYSSSQSVAVGSSFSCPNASIGFCSGSGSATYGVGTNFISYTSSAIGTYTSSAFNGLGFTNLTFASGGTLVGFLLSTNIPGLTAADVTFTASSIFVNLQGLSQTAPNSFFTLTLISSATSVPEPGMMLFLAAGLAGLALFLRPRHSA